MNRGGLLKNLLRIFGKFPWWNVFTTFANSNWWYH